MRERGHEMRNRFPERARPRSFVVGGSVRGNTRPPPAFTREPAFFLKFRVGSRDGVWGDAEIASELPDRRQRITGSQLFAFDEATQLIPDLLKWRRF